MMYSTPTTMTAAASEIEPAGALGRADASATTSADGSSTSTLASALNPAGIHLAKPDEDEKNVELADLPLALTSTRALASPLPSKFRRYLLLSIFLCAQFFDVYLSSATIVAIATITKDLSMTAAESSWLVNSYTLTLAAFLLAAGRISDMFSAKWTFVCGFAWVGIFCLGIGFSRDKTTLIVLRAFSGIGASATIPAALNLIVHLFPDEKEQAGALSAFGATGSLANVSGLILGGLLLLADWTWIFYLVTIITIPGSIAAALLIPAHTEAPVLETSSFVDEKAPAAPTALGPKPKMDYVGLLLLTSAVVLLIFGVSNGNVAGWMIADTLVPLILGVLLFPAFFLWELRMPPIDALIHPATWQIKNFKLLAVLSLVPYFYWFNAQVVFSDLLQKEWGTSPVITAVMFLPNGIAGGFVTTLHGYLPKAFTLKQRIIVGSAGAMVGSILLSFASRKDLYWPLIFPGLLIGSGSNALVFATFNVSIMLSAPAEHSGVAGAVFNSSLQLGSSVGLSLATVLQISFPSADHPLVPSWKGYQSSLYLSTGCTAAVILATLAFYKDPLVEPAAPTSVAEEMLATGDDALPHATGLFAPSVKT